MNLDGLLARLDHGAALRPDAATLFALHRAWRCHIPYENLDIQLGRPIRLDDEALADKFSRRGRGGFCYESNGALALLLRRVGFRLRLVEGAVLRAQSGDRQWGNHVALLVEADDQLWLADVGLADAFPEPLPLVEGTHQQGEYTYALERLDHGTWRMHHHPRGTVSSYDFRTEARELADFAKQTRQLSASSESPYVRVLLGMRHNPETGGETMLRSRELVDLGPAGRTARTLEDSASFRAVLRDALGVPLRDIGEEGLDLLWDRAVAQHARWRQLRADDIAVPTEG